MKRKEEGVCSTKKTKSAAYIDSVCTTPTPNELIAVSRCFDPGAATAVIPLPTQHKQPLPWTFSHSHTSDCTKTPTPQHHSYEHTAPTRSTTQAGAGKTSTPTGWLHVPSKPGTGVAQAAIVYVFWLEMPTWNDAFDTVGSGPHSWL